MQIFTEPETSHLWLESLFGKRNEAGRERTFMELQAGMRGPVLDMTRYSSSSRRRRRRRRIVRLDSIHHKHIAIMAVVSDGIGQGEENAEGRTNYKLNVV